jgi:capsular exopolysaccharide synthesis family protein
MAMPTAPQRPIAAATWHPTEYLRILYKRRWAAIPALVLVFLGGAVSSLQTTPLYLASTQIMVEKDARRATSIDGVLADRNAWYEDSFYATQTRVLQSRQLALRTIEVLEGEGKPEKVPPPPRISLSPSAWASQALSTVRSWFATEPVAAPPANRPSPAAIQSDKVDRFLGALDVVPIRLSTLMDLRFQSPDAEYAARAANALANQYIRYSLELRFDASKEANDWLSGQLEEIRQKVADSDQALQAFKERNRAVSLDGRQSIVVQKLTALNQQLTDARLARFDREARYQQLAELRRRGEPLDAYPTVMESAVVQQLKRELAEQQTRQAEFRRQEFGENYGPLKAVTAEVETTTIRLNAEIGKIAEAVRTEFETARAKEDAMARALEVQKSEALGVDRNAIEYAQLERDAESNRQLYENLLLRTNETSISNEYKGSNIQVVDAAETPRAPVLPNTRRDLMLSGLAGLGMGLLLAFGVEYFDSRIKSPEEIKTHLGLPFLGIVPVAPGSEQAQEAPLLAETVAPAFAEAIRAVRTAVIFSSAEAGARSVVVTSTGPGEGKTVISSSLAIALAQAGQRTLVVDADLRRPRLHEALGRSAEPGLSNVLIGDVPLSDALRATSVANLTMLSAGHLPPNPAELLGSPRYLALFEEMKRRFDWIVLDAPPVMPVTDAAIVARPAGGVVFVIGSEMTPRQSALTALEHLRAANAKFVGAVLNRVNIQRHAYYYAPYYRKDYAKYYQRSRA